MSDKIFVLDGVKKAKSSYAYVDPDGMLISWGDDLDFTEISIKLCTSIIDKAYYAIASLCGAYIDEQGQTVDMRDETSPEKYEQYLNEIKRTLKNTIVPKLKSFRFENHSIWLHDKNEFKSFDAFKGIVNTSSHLLLQRFMKTHNITLEEFLLNHKYAVLVENEEGIFDKFKKMGLIKDIIVEEFTI